MTNRPKVSTKPLFLTLFLAFSCGTIVFSQNKLDPAAIAKSHLQKNARQWGLNDKDIADVVVSSNYRSEHNGVQHVYLNQRLNGLNIFNAVANFNILPSGEVLLASSQFLPNIQSWNTSPSLSADQALIMAANHLKIKPLGKFQAVSTTNNNHEFEFLPNGIAEQNIKIQLCYYPDPTTQKINLAWRTDLSDPQQDLWNVFVDAQSGAILYQHSYMVHCQFHDHSFQNLDADCRENSKFLTSNSKENTHSTENLNQKSDILPPSVKTANSVEKTTENPPVLNGGTYRVFKYPKESPLSGGQELVVNPADTAASPFGWHDTDGVAGAEFNYTRGNNVNAFVDWHGRGFSTFPVLNGGSNLVFDHPYNAKALYDSIAPAALTQLFYTNNALHDVLHRHGFNEESGNFQVKNYTNKGLGNDPVSARAQSGGRGLPPTITLNNATFGTPADGTSGIMRMYLWTRSAAGGNAAILTNLHITAPSNLAGDIRTSLVTFSPIITTTTNVTGNLALYNGGGDVATQACKPSNINLKDKIALIDMGGTYNDSCSYAFKVINAQDSGAIGVILVTSDTLFTQLINDTLQSVRNRVKIPVVGITSQLGTSYKNALNAGAVTASIYRSAKDTVGPDLLDGDFENGIIAHELGHGVSNRLTGGPTNASCLLGSNPIGTTISEQMGEGWSDFLALVMTAKQGDRGEMRRGMGPFVLRQPVDGRGIRRYYYSTDMVINPHSYDSIYVTQASPHPIGEIWCATLWDLYWKMVEKHGWDANLNNFNSGNSKALRLVLDGMKFQGCQPGFIEGRNGILAADRATFNGEHECMIWDVFARRGIGFGAYGGSPRNAGDNIESRERFPTCVKQLKINKLTTPNIKAGERISVELKVINHKDQRVTNVLISDDIPANATFVTGSASRTPTVSGTTISFRLDSIRAGDTATITYQLASSATKNSVLLLNEGFEATTNLFITSGTPATIIWRSSIADTLKNTGERGFVASSAATSDQILIMADPVVISGRQPVLRFAHRFVTEGGQDAGIVEIAEGTSANWQPLHTQMFRNPARGLTFGTYPLTRKAFYGNSQGFINSYVDLKAFVGKEVRVRFRYKTNVAIGGYWAVDDVQLLDMENYESTAKVTSTEGDNITSTIVGRGTIVEPSIRISTKEIEGLTVNVAPNPTTDAVNIVISSTSEEAKLILHSIEGKEIWAQTVLGSSNTPLSMGGFAAGIYFLTVESGGKKLVQKIVKQ
jgi:extracellular elastinolytic metalloproteinase